MGFGVLTGAMMGTTVLTAIPASAQDKELRAEGIGAVHIVDFSSAPDQMLVWDFNCSDGVTVQGGVKVNPDSPIIRNTQTSCEDEGMIIPAGAYAFRKCLLGGGNHGCSEWVAL